MTGCPVQGQVQPKGPGVIACVQLWPKVLRMTQILISTKFAALVSLDIFVRCYYGILKYNYKHFMSVNGFY